jgi:signal transduction histidine kinase
MSQLALASLKLSHAPSERWAHDIRNTLATVGLHLETLERLSGTRGREIAHAAHALMSRAAAMCSDAMAQGTQAEAPGRHKPFDIMRMIVEIANLLRPTAPSGFEIRVAGHGSFVVLADQQEAFRILFNLVHNAIAVARQGAAAITHVTLLVERSAAAVTVRIADDGPGLPETVRANLFRQQQSTTGGSGIGLSIARELAERNGGVLRYAETARGSAFVLELIGKVNGAGAESGALRSLGKRVQH